MELGMALHSHPALDALSPDDFGRVTAMAAALPPDIRLADESEVMLHLHRSRFEAAQIAVLVPFVVEKARELRELFGLGSLGEALGAMGFALTLLSFSLLACVLDPSEADAAEAIATAAAAGESAGPAVFLMTAGAIGALVILALGSFDATHGLCDISPASAILAEQEDWTEAQQEAFDRDTAENTRRAWHWHIAAGMSGEF
jgi:hypothetical protein